MTARDRTLIRRRWYVYALALLVACAIAVAASSQPRVYSVEARVRMSPPASLAMSTPYAFYADTMLAFTGTVDRVYNGRHPSIQLSTPNATLFGNGVREGVSVAALQSGNQWQSWQDQPVIVVKANAPSEADALASLLGAIGEVSAITTNLQVESGVPPSQQIVARWDEREFIVESFGRTPVSTFKGAATLGFLTLAVSALVASGMDRAAAGRQRRRPASSGRALPSEGSGYPWP